MYKIDPLGANKAGQVKGEGEAGKKKDGGNVAATITSRVDRLLAENEAMVGVPLRSLKPNLTYEEKADILEKGRESELITQGEHHPLVEFSPEEQDLFMEEDRNYDFVINKMRQKQQKHRLARDELCHSICPTFSIKNIFIECIKMY